jgi:hypothetical protein
LLTLLLTLYIVAIRASITLIGVELSAIDNLNKRVKRTIRSALTTSIKSSKIANTLELYKSRLSSEIRIKNVNIIRKVSIRH